MSRCFSNRFHSKLVRESPVSEASAGIEMLLVLEILLVPGVAVVNCDSMTGILGSSDSRITISESSNLDGIVVLSASVVDDLGITGAVGGMEMLGLHGSVSCPCLLCLLCGFMGFPILSLHSFSLIRFNFIRSNPSFSW